MPGHDTHPAANTNTHALGLLHYYRGETISFPDFPGEL